MSDDFSTEVTQRGTATTIRVRGQIDIATCERLRDAIEPHLGPAQTIVLDLSGVVFADSAFLEVLVQARGRLTPDGGSLVLRNPSVATRRLLTVAEAKGLLAADAAARGTLVVEPPLGTTGEVDAPSVHDGDGARPPDERHH